MPLAFDVTPADKKPLMCTTTDVEIHEEPVNLVVAKDKSYLYPKLTFCQRFPNVVITTNDQQQNQINLKQIMFSAIIQLEEHHADFLWHYKSEVTFKLDMNDGYPPRPYLTEKTTDFNRRHSQNPVPENKKGVFCRPDIIVVKGLC